MHRQGKTRKISTTTKYAQFLPMPNTTTLAKVRRTHTQISSGTTMQGKRLSSHAPKQIKTASYLFFFMGFFTKLSSSSLPESASFVAKAGLLWAACTEGLSCQCTRALSGGHHTPVQGFEQARKTAEE